MKLRLLALASIAFLWQCATPPPAPTPVPDPITKPQPQPTPVPPPDDDHRAVSREEFQASAWKPLPAVTGWRPEGGGVLVTLADGRQLSLGFVSPSVVRWWVPAAAGDAPLSPAAVYPPALVPKVQVREEAGTIRIDTTGLGLRLVLADLTWSIVKGEKTQVRTTAGPRVAGRRLSQAFPAGDAATWRGVGLEGAERSAKYWVGLGPDGTTAWGAPVLFATGGEAPFAVALDNSYQTYSRVSDSEAVLGALNGGLDLLVATAAQVGATVEALTALTGRPGLVPLWAHGTALVLAAGEPGAFVRTAKLSVQTSVSSAPASFQSLMPVAAPPRWPDLTKADLVAAWRTQASVPVGAGYSLGAALARTDWTATFGGAAPTLLAQFNNRLPVLAAAAALAGWQARNPGVRSLALSRSGAIGLARWAQPEIAVTAGQAVPVARVVALGLAGFGTTALSLNLSGLAEPLTREDAFRTLQTALLAPVLSLELGTDPAGLWAALPSGDRLRLKALLERRSQLKPLFAQLARQTALTGRPAWLPVEGAENEALVGDTLLTAAVPFGATTVPVTLPGPGVWFDFWSGEEFAGGRSYTLELRGDRPVLFARGGSFVPVREAETFDGKDVYNPLTVHVFPGGRGVGSFLVDDGLSLNWPNATVEARLTFDYGQKDMTLDHQSVSLATGLKVDPYLLYRLHNVYKPKQVKIDGKPIPLFGDSWGITDTDRSAAWYESDHTLLIKTFKPDRDQTIQISF